MGKDANSEVLFEHRGRIGLITLNRPAALNALTEGMCAAMDGQLARWQDDRAIAAVVVRGAGERAFCAGGDIRALYEARRTRGAVTTDFYRREYRLNARIRHFPKPYVALLHGVVMGGGAGVSVHGSHRLADATALFAMPETGIGLFPDVGGSHFLPRLPGEIGMYLALAGARLKRADMTYAGIATHCVAFAKWPALIGSLAAGASIDEALDGLTAAAGPPPLAEHRAIIDRCFSEGSVESVLAALDREEDGWASSTAATIRSMSPTSLKISFRELREGRRLSFDECMRMEFRMVARAMQGHDLFEGVRAAIIDKDKTPAWQPSALADVSGADVDAYFMPLDEADELRL